VRLPRLATRIRTCVLIAPLAGILGASELEASSWAVCDPDTNPPLGTTLGCLESPTLPTPLSNCAGISTDTLGVCYEVAVIGCPSVRTGSTDRLRTIPARLKINEPTTGVLERGTILLLGGFGGTGAWEGSSTGTNPPTYPAVSTTASPDVILALQDLGYRTVQVLWDRNWWDVDDNTSLPGGSGIEQEGMLRTSCRGATVLQWLYNTYVELESRGV